MPRPAAWRVQCHAGLRHPQGIRCDSVASAVAVVLGVKPRPAPGLVRAAQPDQPDDPLTLTRPRCEQLEHPVVVRSGAGEREADLVREVVVADADGIGVAECADPGLGGGPQPDAAEAVSTRSRSGAVGRGGDGASDRVAATRGLRPRCAPGAARGRPGATPTTARAASLRSTAGRTSAAGSVRARAHRTTRRCAATRRTPACRSPSARRSRSRARRRRGRCG